MSKFVYYAVKVCFRGFLIEEIDCSVYRTIAVDHYGSPVSRDSDEGMISDYDSEPEMSEDDVLKYIANEL